MAGGTARFALKQITMGNYFVGIDLTGRAQGTIEETQVREKLCEGFLDFRLYGIRVLGSAQVNIARSRVKGLVFAGIVILHNARAVITDSEISKTGQGIVIGGKAQVQLSRNRITENLHFGVGEEIPECDFREPEEPFAATITGEGNYIPRFREPEGNVGDDVCPDSLAFLKKP